MRDLPQYQLLDPRPRGVAEGNPLLDSVAIPAAELTERLGELPPPSEPIWVAALEGSDDAIEVLHVGGRRVHLCHDFRFGTSPKGRLWVPNPRLVRYLDRHEVTSALDLGCGAGREVAFLTNRGVRVTAVDQLTVPTARALNARYGNADLASFLQGDWFDVLPTLGEFDVVLSLMAFHRDLRQLIPRHAPIWLIQAYSTSYRERTGRPRNPDLAVCPTDYPGAELFVEGERELVWAEVHLGAKSRGAAAGAH